jgi:alpha-glucosidase (family GH31 glycosyl hydrolase)
MKGICYTYLIIVVLTVSSLSAQNINSVDRESIDTNIILPPAWAFGILYGGYTNQKETIERIKAIEKHKYPIDAYWIDSWFWSYSNKGKGPEKYIDFIADTISYPDRKKMWNYLEKKGIKGGFWVWDCILKTGNEKAFHEFESKGFFNEIFINTNSWHNHGTSKAIFQETKNHPGTLCGNIDFTNQEAVKYFKSKMKHFFDEGADFIKLDRTTDLAACKTLFEMSQEFGNETQGRGFMLSHSFGTENEEYKRFPAKWTDDTRSDWTVEKPLVEFDSWVPRVAFKENIAMFTDIAQPASKIPFLANDLGGFDKGKAEKPDEELYIRWLQFSMFNPITEVFSQPENPTSNLAWKYSDRADSIFREYTQWRLMLFPYIYSYAIRSRLEGKHMIGKFAEHKFQYRFGDEMLLAPVYEKGSIQQSVYFPEGEWVNYWTGEIISGNETCLVNAPLQQIPLFIKQGSIIPMRRYAPSVEIGNNKTIILEIYAGARGRFILYEDDGTSNEYMSGKYTYTLLEWEEISEISRVLKISSIAGEYKNMLRKRRWIINLHIVEEPLSVLVNGKNYRFRYDEIKQVASVRLPYRACDDQLDITFAFR